MPEYRKRYSYKPIEEKLPNRKKMKTLSKFHSGGREVHFFGKNKSFAVYKMRKEEKTGEKDEFTVYFEMRDFDSEIKDLGLQGTWKEILDQLQKKRVELNQHFEKEKGPWIRAQAVEGMIVTQPRKIMEEIFREHLEMIAAVEKFVIQKIQKKKSKP